MAGDGDFAAGIRGGDLDTGEGGAGIGDFAAGEAGTGIGELAATGESEMGTVVERQIIAES